MTFDGRTERLLAGQVFLDCLDHVGAANTSLDMALTHEASKSARYFANTSQKDNE